MKHFTLFLYFALICWISLKSLKKKLQDYKILIGEKPITYYMLQHIDQIEASGKGQIFYPYSSSAVKDHATGSCHFFHKALLNGLYVMPSWIYNEEVFVHLTSHPFLPVVDLSPHICATEIQSSLQLEKSYPKGETTISKVETASSKSGFKPY